MSCRNFKKWRDRLHLLTHAFAGGYKDSGQGTKPRAANDRHEG